MTGLEILQWVYGISALVTFGATGAVIQRKAFYGWRVDYSYVTLFLSGLIWFLLGPIGAAMSFGFLNEQVAINDPPSRYRQ